MNHFKQIREFFWPLLEKDPISNPQLLTLEDIVSDTEYLKETLNFAIDNYRSEEERRKAVEGKSSLFISIISVVTSIILGITTVFIKVENFGLLLFVLLILLFVLSTYLIRTIWFSLKVLERKPYYSISVKDFLIPDKGDQYYQRLIVEISNKIRKNTRTINQKVDFMTMAQEYFKRAIIVVFLYSFFIFLYFIIKPTSWNFDTILDNRFLNPKEFLWGRLNIIVLYVIALTSLILSIRANIKK